MPLYALPITAASHPTGTSSKILFQLPNRKRKRSRGSTESSSSSEDERNVPESRASSLPAALTNPLSLAPDEVVQYRLAGLELDEQLPSTTVKDFPHRGLPVNPLSPTRDSKGRGKVRSDSDSRDAFDFQGNANEDGEEDRSSKKTVAEDAPKQRHRNRGTMLRMQHLAVLTAILQRCLQEGDIPRASKAWALLLRAEVGGKGIDLRGSGYWGIGAELLIRFQEKANERSQENGSDADKDEEEQGSDQSVSHGEVADNVEEGKRRWGTAEGLEKAKDYYERLILQHPYKRQFPGSVSALDFWPAMVGCEIYGIQFEQKDDLRKVSLSQETEQNDESGVIGLSDEEYINQLVEDEDDILAAQARRTARRNRVSAGKRWQQREEIRKTALVASNKVAERLEVLMTTPPYSDSHALLRLRGMLALYIGDLSVPAPPVAGEPGHGNLSEEEDLEWSEGLGRGGTHSERRLLFRQRTQEHEWGKEKRAEEWTRARTLFERIEATGGRVDFDFRRLEGGDEHQEGKVNEEDLYSMDD